MKNIKFLAIPALLTMLVSCVNGDDYGTPDLSGECKEVAVTKQVSEITGMATIDNPTQYTDPRDAEGNQTHIGVIEAYVTSSDEGGNFYKSISLVSVDKQIGFSIPVDSYNLYNKYEPGRKVYVKLDSLHYSYTDLTDSYEIGNLYYDAQYDEYSIGRLTGAEFESKIVRSCEKVDEETLVEHISINEALDDSYINKLVEFDNVQFNEGSAGGKYFDINYPPYNFSNPVYPSNIGGATNHKISDMEGNTIVVRLSQYATFTANTIPTGNGKIRGVLTKYNGTYQFMIRTLNDVKLTNDRYYPQTFFEETFDANFTTWTKYNVLGAQVWGSTTFGNPAPSALMNGFSGGNQNNEDWLISPAINLSTNSFAILNFETSTRFNGAPLQVYISTNYDGSSAPNTATWTQLTGFTLPVWTSGSYTAWTGSGGINISSYTGNSNVRIAFKYTSNTSAAAGWEVDNVKVFGQ
ncbi:DUF5689 domain-containing protein [Flavobacterium sp.]|uniref:DUF5689 domain-containing protein n=1 Tax=Flavobacterium sp. TaxID=239 RepID=UPI0028BEAD19|nr:DUF5689 domain-containing protein [Flavobacterium sp.]